MKKICVTSNCLANYVLHEAQPIAHIVVHNEEGYASQLHLMFQCAVVPQKLI